MLSKNQEMIIRAEVEQAATSHLFAADQKTALGHFTEDIIAVSNTKLFASRKSLLEDIGEYYNVLKSVDHASWDDIHIRVINKEAATFTAKFTYKFTCIDGTATHLKGVWTALFVLEKGDWKIRMRHESFEQI